MMGPKLGPPEPEKKSGWIQEAGVWRYYHGDTGEPVRMTGTGIPMIGGTGLMDLAQWLPTHGEQDKAGKWYYLALMVQ